jgi:hypothetical protein
MMAILRLVLALTARRWSVPDGDSRLACRRSALRAHASEATNHNAHAVYCAVVICAAIATVIAPFAARTRSDHRPTDGGSQVEPHGVHVPTDSAQQARASPGWLQRFLN